MKLKYHIGKYTTNEHSVVQPIITIAPIKSAFFKVSKPFKPIAFAISF